MANCGDGGARWFWRGWSSDGLGFQRFRLLGAIGFAFELQDDRSFDQAVEEGHRQRAVGKVLAPFLEVHIGDQSRRVLLVSCGDDLVEQVGRLRAFAPFDSVEPKFVTKCSAEHFVTNVKFPEMWSCQAEAWEIKPSPVSNSTFKR